MEIVVEIRSCLSTSKCNETVQFCSQDRMKSNDTVCLAGCCDSGSFCNAAPGRDLMSFFIALIVFVACQL